MRALAEASVATSGWVLVGISRTHPGWKGNTMREHGFLPVRAEEKQSPDGKPQFFPNGLHPPVWKKPGHPALGSLTCYPAALWSVEQDPGRRGAPGS